MEVHGTDVRARVASTARASAATARLTYGEVDEIFAGARPRRGAVGGAARGRARGRPRARRRSASRARDRQRASRRFEFDADGHVTGVRYEQQTESHRLIEQLMILANEQVAGYLADQRLPTLYRVHERPDPQAVAFLSRAAGRPRRPDAAGAEAHDARSRRPSWRPRRRASCAREAGGAHRARRARAALAQAGLLLAEEPRPRRPGQRRATATSPRRSAATRTWSRTARCCRASASTTPPRRRTSSRRRACTPRRPSARR